MEKSNRKPSVKEREIEEISNSILAKSLGTDASLPERIVTCRFCSGSGRYPSNFHQCPECGHIESRTADCPECKGVGAYSIKTEGVEISFGRKDRVPLLNQAPPRPGRRLDADTIAIPLKKKGE